MKKDFYRIPCPVAVGDLFTVSDYGLRSDFRGQRYLPQSHGVYLGEAFIHRSDGIVVQNHRVLMVGDTKETIIDSGLLKYMTPFKGVPQ